MKKTEKAEQAASKTGYSLLFAGFRPSGNDRKAKEISSIGLARLSWPSLGWNEDFVGVPCPQDHLKDPRMFIDHGGMTSLFIVKSILNSGLIVLSGDVDVIASQTTFISRMMTQLSLVRPGSCHGPLRHTRSSSLNLPPAKAGGFRC